MQKQTSGYDQAMSQSQNKTNPRHHNKENTESHTLLRIQLM